MKKKSILTLLGIFIAVLLIAVLIEGLGKRDEKRADQESILFPGFSADRVSSIEIKTKERKSILSKEGGTWVVAAADNYPADQEAVERMLDEAKSLKSTLIASKSSEKHSQFEVDENSGVGVAMLGADNGNVQAHFFVGKMGSDYMSTYVRKVDQDTVHLVDGYLRGIFDKGARGWRDRAIFDFNAVQAQKLTLVAQEKGEIVIEAKEDGAWQIIKPEIAPADKNAVDGIISKISELSADNFAEKKELAEQDANLLEEYKLDKPLAKATVNLTDGTVRILLVGDKSGQQYYVKRGDKDTIFMLSKSKIDSIFKELKDLKAEPEEITPNPENKPE